MPGNISRHIYMKNTSNAKVSISTSGGTKRGLELAEGLFVGGYLEYLYTPYISDKHPLLEKYLIKRNIRAVIDPDRIKTDIKSLLIDKYVYRSRLSKFTGDNSYLYLVNMIDNNVAKHLNEDTEILFTESLISLRTINRAKEMGTITVLDRTNTHMDFQYDVIKEGYDALGMDAKIMSPGLRDKGIKEYDAADHISVLSSFARKTFIDKGVDPNKLILIPSGVDAERFYPTQKEDKVFRMIFCGVACVKKGTHDLLEAFRKLDIEGSELWIIGKVAPDFRQILGKYEGNIKIVDYVPREELYKYYSQGSVFVIPSLEEGLSKVMLEAMACGLPVIATPNTGAEDVVVDGEDGFIVPVGDINRLTEKILFLYENEKVRKAMGERAREKILNNFTMEHYCERFIEFVVKGIGER